nr:LacI family DNA-binding transcriptional regulator [Pseudarthrobacter albicanus]
MTTSAVHTPRSPVTRKDVARYAGVSTAVVSYVVNGGPKKVAPATEAKVQDAIRVLGYRPNAAARALKLGSSETIGLVIPDNSNPFFSLLAHAVEDAAAELGYALLLTNSDGNLAKERRNIRNLASRQVDGVVLASVLFEPDLEALESAEIPAVLLNHGGNAPGFNSVGVDLAAGAKMAVDHLIGHGHTNIALAMGTNVANDFDRREHGWLQALTAAGLPEGPIVRGDFTRSGGYAAGQRLLASPNRPTAIFASSDMQAIGILRAIHEAGLDVPGDIALTSFDGSAEAEYSWPALTTVEQPVRIMAEAAVSALVGTSRGQEPEQRIFPTELRIRQSCGCGVPGASGPSRGSTT